MHGVPGIDGERSVLEAGRPTGMMEGAQHQSIRLRSIDPEDTPVGFPGDDADRGAAFHAGGGYGRRCPVAEFLPVLHITRQVLGHDAGEVVRTAGQG